MATEDENRDMPIAFDADPTSNPMAPFEEAENINSALKGQPNAVRLGREVVLSKVSRGGDTAHEANKEMLLTDRLNESLSPINRVVDVIQTYNAIQ